MREAGYEIEPWEMAMTPQGFYHAPENRIAATRWLVDKLRKDPRDVTQKDFYGNRLRGLLVGYYRGSPYEALHEAGLVTEEDKVYMKHYPWSTKRKVLEIN